MFFIADALVHDQLGRLRLLFGDLESLRSLWTGRVETVELPGYTSRTLYPCFRSETR
jgi:hypothetical protein